MNVLCEGILRAIDANGGYWLPVGFDEELHSTALHRAIRYLSGIHAITKAECDGSFQKWTRTKPH